VTHTFLDPRCPRCAPLREASAMEARKRQDAKRLDPKDDSATAESGDAQ
jgi:hypothetical protein